MYNYLMEKLCNYCNEKPRSEIPLYLRQGRCTDCGRERQRVSYHKYKTKRREFIKEVKSVPCTDCGVQYPSYIMQFDHLPGEEKEFNISRTGYAIKRVEAEIKKCDVVCANCHATRTWERSHV